MSPGRHQHRARGRGRGPTGARIVVALAAAASSAVACSAKHVPPPGALLLAIDSNLKVPDDIDEIGVAVVSADGKTITTDQVYGMAPTGAAKFPATLAILRGTSEPIDIKVAGYKSGQAFALRELVTTIPDDRTALLRVDLNWLDTSSTSGTTSTVRSLASTCESGQTSVAGSCASFQLDSASLAAYEPAALVASDGPQCLDVPACLVDAIGGASMTVPASALVLGASDDGTPSCALPASTTTSAITGAFNIGLVLAPGSDGWCGAAGCVIPLANDPVEGWHLDASGAIELPAKVCTHADVGAVVVVPTSSTCPQYAASHPVCQSYGKDGGAEDAATPPPDATVVEGGLDAGEAGADAAGSKLTGGALQFTPYTIAGVASDGDESNIVILLRSPDGGAGLYVYKNVPGSGPTKTIPGPPTPVAVDTAPSFDMAAAPGLVAIASNDAVQVLNVPALTDAGYYGGSSSTPVSLIYEPVAGGSRLAFGKYNYNLSFVQADGGLVTQGFYPGPVNALAYEPSTALYAIANFNYVTGGSTTSDVIALGSLDQDSGTPANNPPVVAQANATTVAMAFAASDTLVWWGANAATGTPTMYSASVTASKSPGTPVSQSVGLYTGVRSMVGGGGRVFWIGADEHLYEMTFAAGVATGGAIDISAIVGVATATQLGLTATHILASNSQTFAYYNLADLP